MKINSFNSLHTNTSTIFNGNNQYHNDPNHQQYLVSLLKTFEPTMRTIIETRHMNIENRAKQIFAFQNTASSTQS